MFTHVRECKACGIELCSQTARPTTVLFVCSEVTGEALMFKCVLTAAEGVSLMVNLPSEYGSKQVGHESSSSGATVNPEPNFGTLGESPVA